MREIYDWLENVMEDQLQLKEEFKSHIETSERELAEGKRPRVRQPLAARFRFITPDLTLASPSYPRKSEVVSNPELMKWVRVWKVSLTIE